jgi:hypothetical protein
MEGFDSRRVMVGFMFAAQVVEVGGELTADGGRKV